MVIYLIASPEGEARKTQGWVDRHLSTVFSRFQPLLPGHGTNFWPICFIELPHPRFITSVFSSYFFIIKITSDKTFMRRSKGFFNVTHNGCRGRKLEFKRTTGCTVCRRWDCESIGKKTQVCWPNWRPRITPYGPRFNLKTNFAES